MAKASKSYRAFTLTEILVVIGIIVLLIVVAVPALGLLTGSRSIDRAENNLSAMLGRARADAIGLQKTVGVLFFLNPNDGLVTCAEVYETDRPAAGVTAEVHLDLVPDRDWTPLPKGVMAQVIDNSALDDNGTPNDPTDDKVRLDDGYLGYNTAVAQGTITQVPYGGVILFDSGGRLVSRSYAFRGNKGSTTDRTDLMHLLLDKSITSTTTGTVADIIPHRILPAAPPNPATPTQRSAFGFVLLDGESFSNNGGNDDPQATGATVITAGERGEEQWIDENSVPLLINRYNGTLIRGE